MSRVHSANHGTIALHSLVYNVGDLLAIVAEHVPTLNSDQLTVFTSIMAAVNDSEQYPRIFFADGPGGTGKTFLNDTLLVRVR